MGAHHPPTETPAVTPLEGDPTVAFARLRREVDVLRIVNGVLMDEVAHIRRWCRRGFLNNRERSARGQRRRDVLHTTRTWLVHCGAGGRAAGPFNGDDGAAGILMAIEGALGVGPEAPLEHVEGV